jgi:hypothetical protein
VLQFLLGTTGFTTLLVAALGTGGIVSARLAIACKFA